MNKYIDYFGIHISTAPLRSVVLLVVVAGCLGWTFSPSYAVTQLATIAITSASKSVPVAKIKDIDLSDRIKGLEERERASYLSALEGQRKTIDWWFAFLAIFTTIVGVGGALIPYLLGRKDKETLALEIDAARHAREDAEKSRDQARDSAAKSKQYELHAADLLKGFKSSKDSSDVEIQKQKNAAQQVLSSSESSPVDRLRAQAFEAGQSEDSELALLLWKRVMQSDPRDGNAAFNYAYWLQNITTKKVDVSIDDWVEVQAAYDVAKKLDKKRNPNLWILINQNSAIGEEANLLASQGRLEEAHKKWQRAAEMYRYVLGIKPAHHGAANNFGGLLICEYKALRKSPIPEVAADAEKKLHIAKTLLEEHSAMSKEGGAIVAYNLACIYSLLGRHHDALVQLEISRSENKEFPGFTHILEDEDFSVLKVTPEFQDWMNLSFKNNLKN